GPVARNWAQTQGYPVPENFAYTNASLQTMGTDGKPLGDLNWYLTYLAVRQVPNDIPTQFSLSQNYPNPFNPSTEIKVSLVRPGIMSLTIYNVLGQLVDVVDRGYKPAGTYTYNVNMDKYASGVYFYSLHEGSNLLTRKMLLLK
ncbi:MAG: T9SS type A sorting domain-containing protein, partial [Bacteroidetes bacterium]|nr:T9SS type A sorting domain-containing protein [Bacteroidota bacterium]